MNRPIIVDVIKASDPFLRFRMAESDRDGLIAYIEHLEKTIKSRDDMCSAMSEQIEKLSNAGGKLSDIALAGTDACAVEHAYEFSRLVSEWYNEEWNE